MSLLRSKVFLTALILVFGGLTAANAQFSPGMVMRATMPTSFVVNGKMMPAGRYQIRRTGTSASAEPNQLIISNNQGNSAFLVGQVGEQSTWPTAHDAIVLKRIGGDYYLSRIMYAGQSTGFMLPSPKTNREYIGRYKGKDTIIVTMSSE